ARAVVLPFAEAAVDVDKPADLELVERLLAGREAA
ncbi:MAG TPA: MobA-like NTP transferase domain containing protein, partial [Rhodospirillales bacterium]|nr:MobA-like NTP transferase domain containing protein [Rhodospirillales bacterium]